MNKTGSVENTKRLAYIDIAKGILIILVVVGHVLTGSVFVTKTLIRIIGSFHMPAFFVLSGLLANEEKIKAQSFIAFLKKKAVRLLVPYLVFEFLGVFLRVVLIPSYAGNIFEVLGNILTAYCYIGTDWFLVALFFAELLQYWILKCVRKEWRILVIVISLALAFFLPEINWMVANCRRICAALSFILIGMCGKKFFEYNSKILFIFSAVGLLVGAAINTGTPSIGLRLFENPLLFILCGICGTYVTLFISKQISRMAIFSKLFVLCGKASLVIMGTHYIVLLAFTILYGNWTAISIKLALLALIAVIEFPVIMLCKKYLPSWIGEKRKTFVDSGGI